MRSVNIGAAFTLAAIAASFVGFDLLLKEDARLAQADEAAFLAASNEEKITHWLDAYTTYVDCHGKVKPIDRQQIIKAIRAGECEIKRGEEPRPSCWRPLFPAC